MSKNNSEPDEKMFGLKDIEMRMIGNITERNNAALVDYLSFVAIDRLAYNVTPLTTFRVDGEGNLYVSERPKEPETKEEEVATA